MRRAVHGRFAEGKNIIFTCVETGAIKIENARTHGQIDEIPQRMKGVLCHIMSFCCLKRSKPRASVFLYNLISPLLATRAKWEGLHVLSLAEAPSDNFWGVDASGESHSCICTRDENLLFRDKMHKCDSQPSLSLQGSFVYFCAVSRPRSC